MYSWNHTYTLSRLSLSRHLLRSCTTSFPSLINTISFFVGNIDLVLQVDLYPQLISIWFAFLINIDEIFLGGSTRICPWPMTFLNLDRTALFAILFNSNAILFNIIYQRIVYDSYKSTKRSKIIAMLNFIKFLTFWISFSSYSIHSLAMLASLMQLFTLIRMTHPSPQIQIEIKSKCYNMKCPQTEIGRPPVVFLTNVYFRF